MPITTELAIRLQLAVKGREGDAPLLLQDNDMPWPEKLNGGWQRRIGRLIKLVGLDPREVSMYALRHSSIVRTILLLKNVPTRVAAELHDTSI